MTAPTMIDVWQGEANESELAFLAHDTTVELHDDGLDYPEVVDYPSCPDMSQWTDDERQEYAYIQRQIDSCHHKGNKQRPEQGDTEEFTYVCHHHREGCEVCLRTRILVDIQGHAVRAMIHEKVRYFYGSNEMVDDLIGVNDLKGPNFYRIPLADNRCLIFVSENIKDESGATVRVVTMGEPITPETLDRIDWRAAAMTPESKRPSGHLGANVSIVKREKTPTDVVVELKGYVTKDLSQADQQLAIDLAIEETNTLDPGNTKESLQSALQLRSQRIIENMRNMGAINLMTVSYRKTVSLDSIVWNNPIHSNLSVTRTLYEKRLAELKKQRLNRQVDDQE